MKKLQFILFLALAFFTINAQENQIVRYLQIEKGGDDYEVLNINEGVQYSIRTEADENNHIVVRVYDHHNQILGEYPENSIIYPLYDEEPVLGPNTVIIRSEQNEEELINLEDDLIVFKKTANSQKYEVGTVLFGGPSFEAPYGYLRKVISKEEKDGQIVLETEIASLLDAFDEISIHRVFDYETLMDEETSEVRFALVAINGVSTRAMYNVGEMSFSAKKEIIKDILELNLTFKGKIQLEFVFVAKKTPILGIPYDVKEFKLVGHFGLDANLLSSIKAKITIADKELGKIALPNITIPILGVPIVLRNEVVFKLDAKSEVGIKFDGGVHGKITAQAGVHYKNGLNGVASFNSDFNVTLPVLSGFSDKISLYIVPELQVTPYGIKALTGYVNIKFGPTFTLQSSAPQWKLSLGGNVNAGLKLSLIDFLGIKIGATYNYSAPSFVLFSMQGNIDDQKPSLSTLQASNIGYSQATLKGNVTKSGLASVTNRGFQWGLNTSTMTNTVKAGSGLGDFESQIAELQSDKTYFFRTYAENYYGTTYGDILSFKSNPVPNFYISLNPPYNVTTSSVMASTNISRGSNSTTTIPDEYGFVWTTNSFPTAAGLASYPNKISVPVNQDAYSATITGLSENTEYSVRAYIKYAGKTEFSSDEKFKTNLSLTFDISNPTSVSNSSAAFNVNVTSSAPITDKGICYEWQTTLPKIDDGLKVSYGSGTGSFNAILYNLQEFTYYYARPFAEINGKTYYGEIKEFFTLPTTFPLLTTNAASNISSTSATLGGDITDAGMPAYTERGVCYSITPNPTTDNNKTEIAGIGTGVFSIVISDLTANTTYYVRAFAINELNTVYGDQVTFTTLEISPSLTTSIASDISTTSASLGGNITNTGTPSYYERGVCYSTIQNPTTNDDNTEISGTGTGSFSTIVSGLTENTTYYVRAYAVNEFGTVYGDQVYFTTLGLPSLTTNAASNIGSTSATIGGDITHEGTPVYNERGVCYSTIQNPTTNDNKTEISGTGTGNFSTSITVLTENTTYYVRAYVINELGTVYGDQVNFTTLCLPSITTNAANNIGLTSATLGGDITHEGTPSYNERGVCYSTTQNPTINDNKTEISGTGTGIFSISITSLIENTTYYVRAYAINELGTVYGDQVNFTTLCLPSLTTNAATNIGSTSALLGGDITHEGTPSFNERGVCYSTTQNPTTNDNKTEISGTGTGSFSTNITSLTDNTTYYVRAYAINELGTVYGNQVSFITPYASNQDLIITSTSDWNAALASIRAGGDGSTDSPKSYTLYIGGEVLDGGVFVPGSSDITTSIGTVQHVVVKLTGNFMLSLDSKGSILYIGKNQTLIIDSENLNLQGLGDNNAALLTINNGTLEIKNGNIFGNTNNSYGGGGIHVIDGIFNMSGGSIFGNTSNNICGGGGVLMTKGVFTMNGGAINENATGYGDDENTDNGSGGGVNLGEEVSFFMNDGEIKRNIAGSLGKGGGVYSIGIFKMNGGVISDNNAYKGGGVYYHKYADGHFIKSGGIIYGLSVSENYGANIAKSFYGHAVYWEADIPIYRNLTLNEGEDISTEDQTLSGWEW